MIKHIFQEFIQYSFNQYLLETSYLPGSIEEYVKAVYCHPAYLTYNTEYIMRNVRLDEAQAEIKISGKNSKNLRYTDDTTLMAEREEELKNLLMKVKEESEKAGLNSTFKKQRSWHPVPSLHGK